MKKGCYKYFFILLSAVIILSISAHYIQKWQRHHLFCEEIKTGMSEAEVFLIMSRFGEFGISKFDNGEYTKVYVQPALNFKTSLIYGLRGLELNFRKGLLGGVIETYNLENGIYELCKE
jgi:hypothetical protein